MVIEDPFERFFMRQNVLSVIGVFENYVDR